MLYMTDGGDHLTHTRGTVDFLVSNGLMPDLVIVGVNNTNRTRDLGPTRWVRPVPGNPGRTAALGGGADAFLDFFEKELIPYVEGHYRTAPYRIFAGHLLGGLLALYVFAARLQTFNAVIAASPALDWDEWYSFRREDRREFPGVGRSWCACSR